MHLKQSKSNQENSKSEGIKVPSQPLRMTNETAKAAATNINNDSGDGKNQLT